MSTRNLIATTVLTLGGILGGASAATADPIPPRGVRLEFILQTTWGPAVLRQLGYGNDWIFISNTGQTFHYTEVERQPGYLELRGDCPGVYRVQIQANGALWVAPYEFIPLQFMTFGYLHTT